MEANVHIQTIFWKFRPKCSIMNFWNSRHIYEESSSVWLAKQSKHTRLLQAIHEIWQNLVLFRFKQRLHYPRIVATGQCPQVNLPSATVSEWLEKSPMSRVRQKFWNPLVHRTTIIENLVVRDPKVLVQKDLFKLYLKIKLIQHVAFVVVSPMGRVCNFRLNHILKREGCFYQLKLHFLCSRSSTFSLQIRLLQCQATEILTSIALESCVFSSFHNPALQGPCLSSCHNCLKTQMILCLILWLTGLEEKQTAWTDAFEIPPLLTRI